MPSGIRTRTSGIMFGVFPQSLLLLETIVDFFLQEDGLSFIILEGSAG